MTCPICDQKPMNCDCTEAERRQWREIEDLRLTEEEREALEWFAAGDETCFGWGWKRRAETLRGLLDRHSGT